MQNQLITIHAKVAVNRDNRQDYQLGRQPLTILSFIFTGHAYDRLLNSLSTAILHKPDRIYIFKYRYLYLKTFPSLQKHDKEDLTNELDHFCC